MEILIFTWKDCWENGKGRRECLVESKHCGGEDVYLRKGTLDPTPPALTKSCLMPEPDRTGGGVYAHSTDNKTEAHGLPLRPRATPAEWAWSSSPSRCKLATQLTGLHSDWFPPGGGAAPGSCNRQLSQQTAGSPSGWAIHLWQGVGQALSWGRPGLYSILCIADA